MSVSESVFDVEELRSLLGGDEETVGAILSAFLEVNRAQFSELEASCEGGDATSLIFHVHRLKGSAGNVRATALYHALVAFEEELRAGVLCDRAARLGQVRTLFEEFGEVVGKLYPKTVPRSEGR